MSDNDLIWAALQQRAELVREVAFDTDFYALPQVVQNALFGLAGLLEDSATALEAANARVARIERLLEHIDAARAGYDALVARANQLEKALNEALDALKDARFTFMSLGEHGYEDDCTEAIRCGEAALAGVPAEPATEEKP